MVLSWLLNSLSKEIADSVIYSKTAKDLRKELEHRFGQSNGAQLYHVQKELSDLVQGSNDIAGQCGGKEKITKSIQDERFNQFLMGLNDVYAAGKSNILMLSPLPSVNHAYSLLMQDEKQREVYISTHYPGNSASFLAANQNTLGQRSGYYKSKGKKTTVICSHCKKPGHSVDKCYKIIGFPSDFKFTKKKRFQGSVKSNAAYIEGTQGLSGAHFNGEGQGQHFTQDQYSQLIQMLQNVKVNQLEGSTGDASANAVTCAVMKEPRDVYSCPMLNRGKKSTVENICRTNILSIDPDPVPIPDESQDEIKHFGLINSVNRCYKNWSKCKKAAFSSLSLA